MRKKFSINIAFYLALVFLSSCINTRRVTNFNDLQDSQVQTAVQNLEPVIRKNDLLSISISSLNPEATRVFNVPNMPVNGSPNDGSLSNVSGYLVNQEGNIKLPIIGVIKADGLTKKALAEKIAEIILAKKLLVDPIVNIRYLNYRVTVLGEVNRPSVINLPGEKATILEALGLAGDLTIYAKRESILLIREEEEGLKTVKRLDLTSKDFLTSPYYYLRSNDVLYVEPNKAKVANAGRLPILLPAIFAALSFAVILVDRTSR